MRKYRVHVHLTDGTDRVLVIGGSVLHPRGFWIEDGVVHFGRGEGDGFVKLLAAPLTSVICWD